MEPEQSRIDAESTLTPSASQQQFQANKYHILTSLGRGGSAVVKLAIARGMAGVNKLVVLKTIRDEYRGEHDFVRMFLNEARLAARMNHPNVVQTYEVSAAEGVPVIVMEYLDGQPLSKLRSVATSHPLYDLRMRLTIICRMLKGLQYAHSLTDFRGQSLNVIHRDATPHNLMLTYEGQVKVLDFGIAKLGQSHDETKTGTIKGKLGYMPPEQLQASELTAAADIFSVGVILWEELTGRRMWQGMADPEVMARLLTQNLPKLRDALPDVDPKLEAICQKALEPDPEQRYATAAEFEADLEAFLSTRGGLVSEGDIAKLMRESCFELRERQQHQLDIALKQFVEGSPEAWEEAIRDSNNFRAGPPEGYNAHSSISSAGDAKQSLAKWIGLAALVVSGAVIAAWVSRHPTDSPKVTPTAPAASATPVPKTPAPLLQETVQVSISVAPANAVLYLDGRRLGANPYFGQLPKDATEHFLEAKAPGYEDQSDTVTFDANVSLHIALRELPDEKKPAKSQQRARRRSAPAKTPKKSSATAPKPTSPNCDPPYTIDGSGIKRYKRECFGR